MLIRIKRREARQELMLQNVSHWMPGAEAARDSPASRKRARSVRSSIMGEQDEGLPGAGGTPLRQPSEKLAARKRALCSADDEPSLPSSKGRRRIAVDDSDDEVEATSQAIAEHAGSASARADDRADEGYEALDGEPAQESALPDGHNEPLPPMPNDERVAIGDAVPHTPQSAAHAHAGSGAPQRVAIGDEAEAAPLRDVVRGLASAVSELPIPRQEPVRCLVGDLAPAPPANALNHPAQREREQREREQRGVAAPSDGAAHGEHAEQHSESGESGTLERGGESGERDERGERSERERERGVQQAGTAVPWIDGAEASKVKRTAAAVIRSLPPAWRGQLRAYGTTARLPLHRRIERTCKRLERLSYGQLSVLKRTIEHLSRYVRDEGLAFEDIACKDVIMDALEEYDEAARRAASERAAKRAAKGKPPRRNDRGGATATMPIYNGMVRMAKLGIDIAAPDADAKEVAKAGPGMPAVQPMMSLGSVEQLEDVSSDAARSACERAYAGGGWLTASGGTRCIDLQRTATIRFEKCNILGKMTTVACGVARRSKAASQIEMRPLAWRAPLIAIGARGDIDLQPLVAAMPASGKGCVFRDFETPEGMPHSIIHATGWLNKAASYETVVRSLRDLTGQHDLGTHNGRHVLPEVALGLLLPKQVRERLGYWREQPTIGDSVTDQRAIDRAIAKARERHTRASALAAMPDRYASVDADVVVTDNARAACLLACREAMKAWGPGNCPASTREQIAAIAAANQ
jgi:hypothetical protein